MLDSKDYWSDLLMFLCCDNSLQTWRDPSLLPKPQNGFMQQADSRPAVQEPSGKTGSSQLKADCEGKKACEDEVGWECQLSKALQQMEASGCPAAEAGVGHTCQQTQRYGGLKADV